LDHSTSLSNFHSLLVDGRKLTSHQCWVPMTGRYRPSTSGKSCVPSRTVHLSKRCISTTKKPCRYMLPTSETSNLFHRLSNSFHGDLTTESLSSGFIMTTRVGQHMEYVSNATHPKPRPSSTTGQARTPSDIFSSNKACARTNLP